MYVTPSTTTSDLAQVAPTAMARVDWEARIASLEARIDR